MRYLFSLIFIIAVGHFACAQKSIDSALKQWNSQTVPYVYINEIAATDTLILLDTRQREEYDVSHLQNAIWVGHKDFQQDLVLTKITDKDAPIVVYCSIGVRSEDIGEKLLKAGYTNVKNLYGGIFEWKNQDNDVYNNKYTITDTVHTFNKQWGKLLKKGVKVYGKE